MATIIDKKVNEKKLNHILLPDSHREFRLKKAIKETIDVGVRLILRDKLHIK
jgi:hypothetical protein